MKSNLTRREIKIQCTARPKLIGILIGFGIYYDNNIYRLKMGTMTSTLGQDHDRPCSHFVCILYNLFSLK